MAYRNRLMVARDAFRSHPDMLLGHRFQPYMLSEMIALALLEQEEIDRHVASR